MLQELMKLHMPVDSSQVRATQFLSAQDQIEKDKIDRVVKGSGFMKITACPLCASAERKVELTKHGIDLMHCLNCDVRYSESIPADLNDIYDDAQYVVHSKEDSDEHFRYRRARFGVERVSILERVCGDLTDKKIVDIGCGTGFFISAAADKSRQVYGAEFSDNRRTEAVARTGLTVFSETLDEFPMRDFDIVTAFDVLEHIPDPMPFVNGIDSILKPGGYVFLYVPNFDSFSMAVMRQYSPAIDSTEHVVMYNLNALRFLAEMMNYEIVFTETQGMDIDNIIAMSAYLDQPSHPFLNQWKNELQAMVNSSHCADSLRIILRKPF